MVFPCSPPNQLSQGYHLFSCWRPTRQVTKSLQTGQVGSQLQPTQRLLADFSSGSSPSLKVLVACFCSCSQVHDNRDTHSLWRKARSSFLVQTGSSHTCEGGIDCQWTIQMATRFQSYQMYEDQHDWVMLVWLVAFLHVFQGR